MKWTLRDALLATLCYSDIFDYPLSDAEVSRWLAFVPRSPRRSISSLHIPGTERREGFWYLSGRSRLVVMRKKRAAWAKEKWAIARGVGRFLRLIPSLALVGVTGGLAMDNAGEGDDIDFFCITAPRTLWISRLLATLCVTVLGRRRRPGDIKVRNKICLNMFMTSDALGVVPHERDLFSAHEVLQMRPVWQRGTVYGQFLQKNQWVKMYLPNAWEDTYQGSSSKREQSIFFWNICIGMLRSFEPLARWGQRVYMNHRRTNEVISDTVLRFHPHDARGWIKEKLGKRLGRLNIPLDNVFSTR